MHFIVSWDIKSGQPEWNIINEALKNQLKPYSWVKPLTTLYIVNVPGQTTWNSISSSLQQVANLYQGKVDLILSPLMSGGRYDGILSKQMWEEINKRSQ